MTPDAEQLTQAADQLRAIGVETVITDGVMRIVGDLPLERWRSVAAVLWSPARFRRSEQLDAPWAREVIPDPVTADVTWSFWLWLVMAVVAWLGALAVIRG